MSRKRHEEHENHERWLVSYADFITLLFAFFVVLYATSNQNIDKEKQFEDSIKKEMRLPSMVSVGTGSSEHTGTLKKDLADEAFSFTRKRRYDNGELEETVQKILDKNLDPKTKQETIANVQHNSLGVRITLAANAFFPSGSTKLKAEAVKPLETISAILKKIPNNIVIEGHTDSQALVTKSSEIPTNWELASVRATTVLRYLIKVQGIDPQRLSATSYADQRPLVEDNSEDNRAKNRRIEIFILNNEDDGKD